MKPTGMAPKRRHATTGWRRLVVGPWAIAIAASSIAAASLFTLTSANAEPPPPAGANAEPPPPPAGADAEPPPPAGEDTGPEIPGEPAENPGENITSAVQAGVQIYSCQQQDDGSFAFAQENVDATLEGGIAHSFVQGQSGPPQWVAPDGSAVTGQVASSTDAGPGNIPSLRLTATPSGSEQGLLAGVTEILRESTSGGVAPAGTCDPASEPTISVPYNATYVFVKG